MKQTAESVLKEYIQFNDVNQSETIELLPLTIIDAMEEYANENQIAIEFAEWCVKNELFYSIQYGRIETKKLLEIYKKEKGL